MVMSFDVVLDEGDVSVLEDACAEELDIEDGVWGGLEARAEKEVRSGGELAILGVW